MLKLLVLFVHVLILIEKGYCVNKAFIIDQKGNTVVTEHKSVYNGHYVYDKTFVPTHATKPVILHCLGNYTKKAMYNGEDIVSWYKLLDGKEMGNRKKILNSTDKYLVYYEPDGLVIKSYLVISKPSADDAGPYQCEFKTNDPLPIDQLVAVDMAAVVKSTGEWSMYGKRGGSAFIQCSAQGYPKPTIEWRRDNVSWTPERVEVGGNDSFTVTSETAYFPDLEYSHRAFYWCRAVNTVGEDEFIVFLRVKDPLAAVWPLIGIIILAAVLAGVIGCSEWKGKKAKAELQQEFDEVAAEAAGKSAGKHEEGELRHRSV